MDTSGEQSGLMAETLIVLAGENAWSAARAFAQQSVRDRDVTRARYWRSVARGVLKKYAARLASSAGDSAASSATPGALETLAEAHEAPAAAPAAPEAPAATPEIATADSEPAYGWKNIGRAPIPLRARRTFPMHATAPEDAPAKALVEDNAAVEMLIARAA